ncbi:MORN repeat-containing protein [Pedobacter flavus]|uniref:MORN repeat protein n=1 Tax=Pedobacter flavus TaxID=3113906 RepID=A0ABU7H3T6_9SPHI|nr:hypothetical protein [Pedobacter sp. VNH31]MEE1885930.1 hypothetical protein [Pedobacter sp. VNH31]
MKKSFLLLLSIFFCFNTYAQEKLSFVLPSNTNQTIEYSGSVINGKANGYGEGIIKYMGKPGGTYKGNWKDNYFHGQGTLDYSHVNAPKGDKYEGDWAYGKFHGKGTYFYLIGDKYIGEFVNGQKSGKGSYFWKSGSKYEGEWQGGYRTGYGKYSYANGKVEEGLFDKNKYLGSNSKVEAVPVDNVNKTNKTEVTLKSVGKLILNVGTYEGEIENGKASGKGKMIYNDGRVLDGIFQNNLPNGKGKMILASGKVVYEGDYLNGQPNGKGKFWYENGNVYEGDFVKGLKQGKGVYIFKNGSIYEGDFNYNNMEGMGKMKYINNMIYEGPFKNGYENGFGTVTSSSGDIYKSEFYNGKCTGIGTVTYKNGNRYQGELVSFVIGGLPVPINGITYYPNGDFFEGKHSLFGEYKGTLYYKSSGKRYEGILDKGLPNGKGILYDKSGKILNSGCWKKGVFDPLDKSCGD